MTAGSARRVLRNREAAVDNLNASVYFSEQFGEGTRDNCQGVASEGAPALRVIREILDSIIDVSAWRERSRLRACGVVLDGHGSAGSFDRRKTKRYAID
jgi:hypothetical protein